MAGISDLNELLKKMKPNLKKEKYYIASVDEGELMAISSYLDYIICVYKETEGLTVVFTEDIINEMKEFTGKISGPFACITLEVNSDLNAIGFMERIAGALAKEKISCNAFSAYYHDHIFIQYERKEDALAALKKLSNGK
jgi:hypothetical protein